jgi:MFS family permease
VSSAPPRVAFLSGYAVLLGNAEVRRLVVGSMIGRLPSAMLPLAIFLMIHGRTRSLAAAGLVVGAYGIGRAAVSPLIGALVDRVGQTRVLSIGVAAQALLLTALVVVAQLQPSVVINAAVAAAAGAASPPVQACLRALWPVVASGDAARDAAYSFDATTQELLWIAGPLIVAALLTAFSPAAIVIVSAVIGCIGVAVFASSPISRGWRTATGSVRVRFGALAGRDLRVLLVSNVLSGCQWGALTFGVTALAVALGNSRASGLLLACISAGSITGGLVSGARPWRWSARERYRALMAATAACGIPLVFAHSIPIAAPLSLLAGIPLAATYASLYILTGRFAPEGTTTEAFTWTSSSFALGVSLGTAGAGVLSQTFDIHSAFAMACLAAAAATLFTFVVRDPRSASSMA